MINIKYTITSTIKATEVSCDYIILPRIEKHVHHPITETFEEVNI